MKKKIMMMMFIIMIMFMMMFVMMVMMMMMSHPMPSMVCSDDECQCNYSRVFLSSRIMVPTSLPYFQHMKVWKPRKGDTETLESCTMTLKPLLTRVQ